ncbi:hypothetical protein TUBRATIS_004170 [Tubulinosema ratisbonensis]|uniref:Uncharacterized protein n=1 Tax=Tubulinosema ratisbonensis TaxID=291195 RepID=A0A437APE3_9MICR|nr:hypothetical protein TUBRATIS_004170 [Tubulinosema ratisbonensis]
MKSNEITRIIIFIVLLTLLWVNNYLGIGSLLLVFYFFGNKVTFGIVLFIYILFVMFDSGFKGSQVDFYKMFGRNDVVMKDKDNRKEVKYFYEPGAEVCSDDTIVSVFMKNQKIREDRKKKQVEMPNFLISDSPKKNDPFTDDSLENNDSFTNNSLQKSDPLKESNPIKEDDSDSSGYLYDQIIQSNNHNKPKFKHSPEIEEALDFLNGRGAWADKNNKLLPKSTSIIYLSDHM